MSPDEDARETDLTPLEQARRTAALCQEKLATDVTILDMRGVCDFTDFFVIATGRNARQTKAIYDEVSGVLKREHDLLPRASAGAAEATWIVADYLDVVLHLFTPETRGFYRLEELWSDVPSIELEVATAQSESASSTGRSSAAAPVRVGASGRRGSRTPTPPSSSFQPPPEPPPPAKSARTNREIRRRSRRTRPG